ncbi:MAG: hypothetical protein LBN01_04100 [Endomicrobium sp.]|nr:hypothetical protein [Endomicrobium sp.]
MINKNKVNEKQIVNNEEDKDKITILGANGELLTSIIQLVYMDKRTDNGMYPYSAAGWLLHHMGLLLT